MPASNRTMINKLQLAINSHGGRILIDKVQFYSEEQKQPVNMYRVSEPGEVKGAKRSVLFQTASQIQVVLFLRDYWFHMQGLEIPTDNEVWNDIKKKKGIVFE